MISLVTAHLHLVIVEPAENLGRINYDCMTQQTLMELLVQGIYDKDRFLSADGTFLDLKYWEGIECTPDGGNVKRIEWSLYFHKAGTIDLQWVPPTVERIDLFGSLLHITNFDKLTPSLEKFNYGNNEVRDKMQNFQLPENLRSIRLQDNFISGTVDLGDFPFNLRVFDADGNDLHGTLDLDKLRSPIKEVGLANNNFEGMIFFDSLPATLKELRLGENRFFPSVCWEKLYEILKHNSMEN